MPTEFQPSSDLRYYIATTRGLSDLDLSGHPEDRLWALVEFEDLVRYVQAKPRLQKED